MSTDLTTRPNGAVTQQIDRWDEPEMVTTLRQTVCQDATPAQFRMFIEVCRATGLNPLLREVWFVPRVGVMAGRDGYLRVANEHPQFDGMDTKVERDAKGIPIKAVCSVWRKDRSHPITCEAYFNEYKKGGQVWQTYPSAMISKVAEVLALKRSFSINGVVSEEEMGEAAALEPTRAEKVAAAKEVGAAKLKALTAPPVVHDAQFVDDEPPQAPPEDKPEPDRFGMLKHFGDLKKEFIALGAENRYRAVLAEFGAKKSNELKPADARNAYKGMAASLKTLKLDIADREETQKLYDSLVLEYGDIAVAVAVGNEGSASWDEVPAAERDKVLAAIRDSLRAA